MTRILIADNRDVVRTGVRHLVETQTGWMMVAEATDGKRAINHYIATLSQ
jgi:DNA-binding NarL/FixJ family response regulator